MFQVGTRVPAHFGFPSPCDRDKYFEIPCPPQPLKPELLSFSTIILHNSQLTYQTTWYIPYPLLFSNFYIVKKNQCFIFLNCASAHFQSHCHHVVFHFVLLPSKMIFKSYIYIYIYIQIIYIHVYTYICLYVYTYILIFSGCRKLMHK